MNARLAALANWLDTVPAHATIQSRAWIVPAVQTVHILAIAALFSAALVLALRSFDVAGVDWSPARWGARLNRWTAAALAVLLLSGVVMITGEPQRALLSPLFQLKMLLVAAAAPLSWLLARRLTRHDDGGVGGIEKLLALLIVLLWVGTISAGRWIAYYAG